MATCSSYAEFAPAGVGPAQQLHLYGVTVIPCLDPDTLPTLREEMREVIAQFPEFKEGATRHVMGGFSAFGNPSSFHNPFVRLLRQWCMHAAVNTLWRDYVAEHKDGFKLEQIMDRMMLRPAGVTPSSESWHRDEATNTAPGDETFGGWLNLDDTPQFFHCVPGTHTAKRGKGGFAPIKSRAMKRRYAEKRAAVRVPPGHVIVFFEHIVHEVRAQKMLYDSFRLFLGWRVTREDVPLIPPSRTAYEELLELQAVMPLKSGQIPAMYAKLHWTNWVDRIVAFSDANVVDLCREYVKRESGAREGETFHVVHRHMRSLQYYGLGKYASYSPEEVKMHRPARSWYLMAPGQTAQFRERVELKRRSEAATSSASA